MPTATVTSKGQVTIPKTVRTALRIGAGDRISFVVRDDGVVELRPETVDLRDAYAVLARKGRTITVEEMNQAIVDAAASNLRQAKRR